MEIIAPASITNDAAGPVTRASTGSYWDSAGVLQTAAANAPRLTYDPADLSAAPYLLLEPAATNLWTWSSDMTQSDWSQQNVTVQSANRANAFGATVSRVTPNSTNGLHFVGRVTPPALSIGQKYTATYALAASNLSAAVEFYDGTGYRYATVDPAAGVIVSADSALGVTLSPLDSFGFCTLAITGSVVGSSGTPRFTLLASGAGGLNFAGDGAQHLDVAFAQLEAGAKATSPIRTTGAAAPRAADVLDGSLGLLWSNIAETDANDGALWASGTAYAVGVTVRRPNHRRYYALQASTGKTPETNTSGTTPIWQDVGPTKRWATFDQKYSTVAANADVVQYLVRPGTVATAVAVLGLDANDVRVSMVDASTGTVVYQSAKNLRIKNCRSWTDYFFKPIVRRSDEVFDDLPPFKSGVILVTVTKKGSGAQVADLVFGRKEYIGEMQWKPEIRTLRRSIITDDGFGGVTFTKRRSSKLITADVSVDTDLADDVVRLLDSYTATPCVIIGDARWTSLIILGFVQDFRLVLEYDGTNGALYNAQIQGFA